MIYKVKRSGQWNVGTQQRYGSSVDQFGLYSIDIAENWEVSIRSGHSNQLLHLKSENICENC